MKNRQSQLSFTFLICVLLAQTAFLFGVLSDSSKTSLWVVFFAVVLMEIILVWRVWVLLMMVEDDD